MGRARLIKKVKGFNLELTNACNLKCNFCAQQMMKRPQGMMELSLACRLIKEVKDTGFCDKVTTNVMGEPLLYKDIFELLKYAAGLKQKITLLTNGERLDDGVSARLLDYPPAEIGISYHAHNEDSLRQRGAAVSYKEYKNKIEHLIELKFKRRERVVVSVNVISTITRPHDKFSILESLEEISFFGKQWIAFAESLKQKFAIRWPVPRRIYPGGNLLLPGFFVTLYPIYHLWTGAILPEGARVTPSGQGVCLCPFEQFNVLWNGDVTICCLDYNGELVYDSVRGKSIKEAFNSGKIAGIRKNFLIPGRLSSKCRFCLGSVVDKAGAAFWKKSYPLSSLERIGRWCLLWLRLISAPKNIISHMQAVLLGRALGRAIQKKYWGYYCRGA